MGPKGDDRVVALRELEREGREVCTCLVSDDGDDSLHRIPTRASLRAPNFIRFRTGNSLRNADKISRSETPPRSLDTPHGVSKTPRGQPDLFETVSETTLA